MSIHRRALALAAATAAAAGVFLGPVAPASAAPNTEIIQISGSFFLIDDDFDFNPTASSTFSKLVALDAVHNRQTVVIPTPESGCAGGEVRAELRLDLIRFSDGRVRVQDAAGGLGLQMFEGASCFSNDLDGSANISDFISDVNSKVSDSAHTFNQDEGGDDFASVSYTVSHTR